MGVRWWWCGCEVVVMVWVCDGGGVGVRWWWCGCEVVVVVWV